MKTLPTVAAIIVNWNNYHDTKECLESLKKLNYRSLNVFIIDNGSTDDSIKKIRCEFPEFYYLYNNENLGLACALNIGLKEAFKRNYDYLWLLNNDTIITDQDYLMKLVTIAQENPSCSVLGSLVLNYTDNEAQSEWFTFSKWRGRFLPFNRNKDVKKITKKLRFLNNNEYLNFCSVLVKRNIFNIVGLFPEDLFLYFEDNIWEDRIRNASPNIAICYTPETFILHKGASSTGGYRKSPVLDYYDTRNFLYFIKQSHPLLINYMIIKSIINKIIPKILRREWVRLRASSLGLIDFFRGKRGKS